MPSPLIEVLATPCQSEDCEDLQHGGRNGKHIAFELGEAQPLESEVEVLSDWRLWDRTEN